MERTNNETPSNKVVKKNWLLCFIAIMPLLVFATFALIVSNAYGATFTVDSTDDDVDVNPGDGVCSTAIGVCTLRAAIQESNAVRGLPTDQINLPANANPYILSLGELQILDSLFINGDGADSTTIDGDNKDRVFFIHAGPESQVKISGVTIRNGSKAHVIDEPGGGIYIFSGSVYLIQSVVRENKANIWGAGISNRGFLQLFESTVRDNKITQGSPGGGLTDNGGGIYNFAGGTIQIDRSTISGNQATKAGGIYNAFRGALFITNSTISGNKARTRGGGILNGGTADISFSTITRNQANADVDGIRGSASDEPLAGGGIYNGGVVVGGEPNVPPCNYWPGCGTISMASTILADNTDNGASYRSPDCLSTSAATFSSFGRNLVGISNDQCNIRNAIYGDTRFDFVGIDLAPIDPRLGPLADNGGPTETHSLLDSSFAIDNGTAISSKAFFVCPSMDQRGLARSTDGDGDGRGDCDIGAFELPGVRPRSPSQPWTHQFGSTEVDVAKGIAVDATGVYVVGTTDGKIPGENSAGGTDAFIRKYDSAGNVQWTRQFGTPDFDEPWGIAVGAGGVYVAGRTTGAFPGESNAGGFDAFLRKYDSVGNVQWTRQFGTSGADVAKGIAVNATSVYVAGDLQNSAGGTDAFIRKYDSAGNVQWTRQFGLVATASGITSDPMGNVYVVGQSVLALPGQSVAGSTDVFVRKYNSAGNELWTRQFGTPGTDAAKGIAADATGVYVVGETDGVLPGQISGGGTDVFVRKYNSNGSLLWTRQFGTPMFDASAPSIAVDGTSVYVAGRTFGTLPGQSSEGDNDAFIRKYHITGAELDTQQFGTHSYDEAWGIAVDAMGVYVGGRTEGRLLGQSSTGDSDIFVMKLIR